MGVTMNVFGRMVAALAAVVFTSAGVAAQATEQPSSPRPGAEAAAPAPSQGERTTAQPQPESGQQTGQPSSRPGPGVQQETGGTWLGEVAIPRAVLADGKPLPAGTYRVRLTSETQTPVVGQDPSSGRWVEFVREGTAVGRELAPFVEQDEVEAVTPRASVPPPGNSRVQTLREAEYLRLWFNHQGDQILVYLPWADAP